MSEHIHLGSILGIDFRFDYSWLIVFVLATWSLAGYYLPGAHPGWPVNAYWIFGVITSGLLFASVVAHELAHTLVARVYRTPVNDVTLFIFGGAPHIGQEPRKPHEEVLIALAGPGASLMLATLFYEVWSRTGSGAGPLHALTGWLAWLNLMLALLNLIPAFPLDGGRIFRAVLWDGTANLRRATTIVTGVGWLIVLILIFYGSWLGFWQLRGGLWGEGLWIAGLGWILNRAIGQVEQQLALHDQTLLAGHTVREAMLADCPRVLGRLTLDVVVAQVAQPSRHDYFLVGKRDQLDGLLTRDRIDAVLRKRWPNTRVEDVMLPTSRLKTVHPGLELPIILETMVVEHEHQLVVVDGERPIGVITRDTVLRFLHARAGEPLRLLPAHV